jgi:hypothetical protein
MASIILSESASSFTRSSLNAIGVSQIPFFGKRITNSAANFAGNIGGSIGRQIDKRLFGTKTVNRDRGPRLSDLQVQSSAYGEFISQIFGTVRVAGNVIWSRPIKESANVTNVNSGGGKGSAGKVVKQTETRYSYSVSLAIAICEGTIDDVLRIWADTKLIDPANYSISYRVYKGTESQNPDSVIESFEGVGKSPAYRGIAYVVFEDFQLAEFGNRIPNFTFEVKKSYKNSFSEYSAEELVKCITLIPGCGEFVYDTQVQRKVLGSQFAGESGPDIFIQSGKQKRINRNTYRSKADVILALDDMQKTFPNLEYVSIVCAWFGTAMTAGNCRVLPGIEQRTGITTTPSTWNVGAYNRSNAMLLSRDENDRPNYGGTPSDSSILNLVTELKSRGLKIMFYPMLFMDLPGKPWRGYITDAPANIATFFNHAQGYNNFILHYANLLKNKVEAFVIGSEFKSLTSVKNSSNQFPAVTQLVSLAASVKAVMGSSTKITYAADWSEYHSIDGWYNLDPLWASPNIDMIGIDAYFPLTDEPQNGNYDLQKTINGWTSGEGYNWYYTDAERTEKAALAPQYAWKNIQHWWSNTHTNPDANATEWVPESKKIWFTEYGFPSADGATNQPNVFYNPDSVSGALPYHSKGLIDYQAQRLGVEATELKWADSNMVENKFLWCFDARPYPYWPDMKDVWSDGNTYQLGHWVNGKFATSGLAEVLKQLCQRSGLKITDIDVSSISHNLDGFVINSLTSIADIISTLREVYFFNITEVDGVLTFSLQPRSVSLEINQDDLMQIDNNVHALLEAIISEAEIPARYDFAYLNRNTNYLMANEHSVHNSSTNITRESNKIPIVLEPNYAKKVAEVSLLKQWAERNKYIFSLPLEYAHLNVGDAISLNSKTLLIEDIFFRENNTTMLSARSFDSSIYSMNLNQYERNAITEIDEATDELITYILDLPCLPQNDVNATQIHFAISSGGVFKGAEVFVSTDDGVNYSKLSSIDVEATIGTVIASIPPSSPYVFDNATTVEVLLTSGQLEGRNMLSVLNGAGAAIIGNEIIQFTSAELIGENRYHLKNLLRGRLGTENQIHSHTEFERFILLNSALLEVPMSEASIGQSRKYKIVPVGQTLLDVEAVEFTYSGNSLKPYSPVNISIELATDDIKISWHRRTRNNGDLRNLVEVPLLESTELYEVDILNDAGQVVRTISSSAPQATYSLPDQMEDFGAKQTSLKANIYQLSEKVGRGYVSHVSAA